MTTLMTILASIQVGCGDERPPVSEEASIDRGDAPLIGSSDDGPAPVICQPATRRACVIAWLDEYGNKICQPTFRVCTHDGRRWTACGDLDAGVPAAAHPDEDAGSSEDDDSGGAAHEELR